jgi:hypothetical protein
VVGATGAFSAAHADGEMSAVPRATMTAAVTKDLLRMMSASLRRNLAGEL